MLHRSNYWIPASVVLATLLVALTLIISVLQQRNFEQKVINDEFVNDLRNHFKESRKPLGHPMFPINWKKEYHPDLTNPTLLFPLFEESLQKDYAKILETGQKCKLAELDSMEVAESPTLEKLKHWYRHKCSGTELPAFVWSEPPFIHPLGGSWARWLVKNGFKDKSWLREQKKNIHILEYSEIVDEKSDIFTKVLASLKPTQLQKLMDGMGIIASSQYLLIPTYYDDTTNNYHVYPRKDWDAFLVKNNLTMLESQDNACVLVQKNYCWKFTHKPIRLLNPNFLQIVLGVLLTFLALYFLYTLRKKYREEQLFHEQQQLVMQTLAHELRHPVTSFRMSVEAMRPFYDDLPNEVGTEFLRLATTSRRMTRLVNYTQNYLQLLFKDGQFVFKMELVESFKNFIETATEEYRDKIEISHPAQDASCNLDAYWVNTCIKNLIVNALTYGSPPVVLQWRLNGEDLEIEVKDHGNTPPVLLDELARPQIKKSGSKGMGLGLSLVKRIVSLMNGELSLKNNPTRFTIKLKGVIHG